MCFREISKNRKANTKKRRKIKRVQQYLVKALNRFIIAEVSKETYKSHQNKTKTLNKSISMSFTS